MKLSFVIPAYNEEAYLDKCLASVIDAIKRGNYDAEVIVVDNASTDGTKEVAKLFKGVRIVNESKKGLVQARQAGFIASKGDLIANVDADTILPEGWIEKVIKEFSKNDKLVALSGPFVYYDLPRMTNALVQAFFYLGSAGNLLHQYIFRKGSILQGGNFVLRRSALEKIGGYNMKLSFWGEDIDIAKRISKVGRVKFTTKFPIYTSGRRLKAEGVFTTGLKAGADYFWITFTGRPFRKTHSQKDIRI
jgi:glycosyltransferase involved in cell wall biosynthesis